MKKLRFFGLLAVTLLAFALVASCGDAGGGPGTPPGGGETPGGSDGTQYSPYRGGTGASGLVIKPTASGDLQRFTLSKSSVSIEEGETFQLEAILAPADPADVEGIEWSTGNPAIAAVSGSGLVTAGTLAGTGFNSGTTNITATVYFKHEEGEVIDTLTATCAVNVYRLELTGITGALLKVADWDIIAKVRDHKDANDTTRTAVKDAVVAKIAALGTNGAKEFGVPKELLSSKVSQPAANATVGGKPTLSYYPVLGGSSRNFTFDFGYNGWSFANMNSAKTEVVSKKDGNSITVTDTYAEYTDYICYPIPGLSASQWPFIIVRIVPCTEITFIVHKDLRDTLATDGLMATGSGTGKQDTTPIIKVVSEASDGPQTTGFLIGAGATDGGISGSGYHLGKLNAVNGGNLSRTVLIRANFAGTKIQLLDAVASSTKPKYNLSGIAGLSSAETVNGTTEDGAAYASYSVGGLSSASYEIRLTREGEALDKIDIKGFVGPLEHGTGTNLTAFATGFTQTVSTDVATATALTWHSSKPTQSNPTPATLSAPIGGESAFAKLTFDPVKGYDFKITSSDITCEVLDDTDADITDDVLKDISFFFGTGDDYRKLTVVLEFAVKPGKITGIAFTSFSKLDAGDTPLPTTAVTSTPANAVPGTVSVSWKVGDAAIAPSAYKAVEGDVLTATITVNALRGFEFDDETEVADDQFDPATGITGLDDADSTDPSVASNKKSVTIVVVFPAVEEGP